MTRSKKTVLIKSNLLDLSSRFPKEIKALTKEGYLVSFLGWDRDNNSSISLLRETEKLQEEIKLRLRAPYGIKVLPFLPIWWGFVFLQLMIKDWDIAHAVNLDSAIPAVIVGKLKRKLVIYDMPDVYEDQVRLPKLLRTFCIKLDKLCMRLASGVILSDEMQIEEVGGIPNSKVIVVYDSPPDIWDKVEKTHRTGKGFTLFFAGGLSSARALNLDNVFTAIKDIEGVRLMITGHGDLIGRIKEWARQMPEKIQFLGWIDSREEVLKSIINEADLLFVLRDPNIPLNKYISGAKSLDARMCGKPLLVNQGTSASIKVSQENCGLVIEDAANSEEIKQAIVKLRDNPELCRELGANARKAYEQKYNWQIMEQRLIALYRGLTSEMMGGQECQTSSKLA